MINRNEYLRHYLCFDRAVLRHSTSIINAKREAYGVQCLSTFSPWHSVAWIKICTPQRFSRRCPARYMVLLRFCEGGGRVLHLLLPTPRRFVHAVNNAAAMWKNAGSSDAGVPKEKGDIPSRNDPSEISIACIPGGFQRSFIEFLKESRHHRHWYDHGREEPLVVISSHKCYKTAFSSYAKSVIDNKCSIRLIFSYSDDKIFISK